MRRPGSENPLGPSNMYARLPELLKSGALGALATSLWLHTIPESWRARVDRELENPHGSDGRKCLGLTSFDSGQSFGSPRPE